MLKVEIFIENCEILASVMLSAYTRVTDDDRQATSYDNTRKHSAKNGRFKEKWNSWI